MCLSKVYVDRGDKEELLMEEVASLKTAGKKLLLKTLLGEEKQIEANIRQIDFTKHSIFLENLNSGELYL